MGTWSRRRSHGPVSMAVQQFREDLRRAEGRWLAYDALCRLRALDPSDPRYAVTHQEVCDRSKELIMKRLVLAVCCLLVPALASAQEKSYQVQIFAQGVDTTSGAPMQATVIPASAVLCNQVPIPVGTTTTINPTLATWDDPVNVGKACTADAAAFLLALPIGNFAATITVTDANDQVSPRSAPSPFVRAAAPAPRTGFRLVRR